MRANAWGNNLYFRQDFPVCQYTKHVFAVGATTTVPVVDALLSSLPLKSSTGNTEIKDI